MKETNIEIKFKHLLIQLTDLPVAGLEYSTRDIWATHFHLSVFSISGLC